MSSLVNLRGDDLDQRLFEKSLRRHLGPVVPFLDDPTVSEVMINGPSSIYIERGGHLELTDAKFEDELQLRAAVRNVAQFVVVQSTMRTLDSMRVSPTARGCTPRWRRPVGSGPWWRSGSSSTGRCSWRT